MTTRDFFLICFAAASVIHAVQTVLSARLLRYRAACGVDRLDARDGVAIGILTFLWQFGNTLMAVGWNDVSHRVGWFGSLLRESALVCFPLLFSYMSLHIPDPPKGQGLLRFARYLRFPLWPWTIVAFTAMVVSESGLSFPLFNPQIAAYITLHVMLFYFAVFTIVAFALRRPAADSGVGALMRASKAGFISGILAVITFVLMLSGYWRLPVPFLTYIELAAMLTSVPFTISVAYRLYQFPFMDAFIREVLSGVILLAGLVTALAIQQSPLWILACATALAYAKPALTRWVERAFMGHDESIDTQEERIGTAIRALTQFDEFGARVSEILAREVDAEWVDLGCAPRADADQRFEIAGSGSWLSAGPRIGGRRYMSRELRILQSAVLQLAEHHLQISRHEMNELAARAQMKALQAQINPHFLFNTLNVLASLIHSNPEKAESVTQELADIFRYALESTRLEWVPLSEELQFLESYLEIEKARFDKRLAYAFEIDDGLRTLKIPPMILQPLVENAIKHGIAPKVEGGRLVVSGRQETDRVVISVEDTGVGLHAAPRHRGSGIGLSNVRERLQHVYGASGTLKLEETQSGGTRAVVVLPQLVRVHS